MNEAENSSKEDITPEFSIEKYTDADRESIIAGLADIQEVERSLSDTRRPGSEMAEEYFVLISKEISEKSGALFVAKNSERVIGFIACWIEHDDDPIQTKESNIYAYISDAWVAADLRDKGIFGKLNAVVEEYIKLFPDVHYIRMNVVATNERAKAAYTKMGYVPEEIKMAKHI